MVPAFTTIVNNGPSSNRIDLVFVGDGYTTGELAAGTYSTHIQTLLDYLFVANQNVGGNQDPFTRYAKYFNVHRIDVVSPESGVTTPQNNITRNTALQSRYRFDGVTDRLLYLNDTITNNLVAQELIGASFQPEMRFAVANSSVYGGGGGQWAMYAGGATGATPALSAVEIALHEVAHSFVNLADEYGGTPGPYTGTDPTEVNVTTNPVGAKWSRWTGYVQPGLGTVGAFDGGRYFDSGIYRPTNSSKMNVLGNPFDAIAREAFVLKFGEFVKPLDTFTSNSSTLVNPANISVSPVDTSVIGVDWYVNGTRVAQDGATTMTPAQLGINNGTFTIRATAYDRAVTPGVDWVRTRQNELMQSVEWTVTVGTPPLNTAPTLDSSGNIFAILGAGSRQSAEMRQGTLVSDLLARGAGGNPISDPDAGALKGIALTAVDQSLGNYQYTLVTNNPAESDWINVDAAGVLSDASALLLPTTARIRFTTGRIPHHASAPPFLALESKLDAGITFRAWDQTSGVAGGRGNAGTNGGSTAFSTATETSKVYFEARLFRHFNSNAGLNVYTLEAEFNALAAANNPAFEDRSTDAWTGFTVLLSNVPELATTAMYRMYYGVQFNANGTQIDMGYRYLTTNLIEAQALENSGPADKRPQRAGAYFREEGVNSGTGILGYIYTTQQPGTQQMRQIYRTDIVQKPTRPAGTSEGGTPTSFTPQENGDHVYTTNTAFETTKTGTWRVEDPRGFVRPLGGAGVLAPATPSGATAAPIARAATVIDVGPAIDLFNASVTSTTFSAILPTSLATTSAAINPDHVSTTVDVGLIAPTVPAIPPQALTGAPADDETDYLSPHLSLDSNEETAATDILFASLGTTANDLCPW